MINDLTRFLILYGSETGQSEAIAEKVHEEAKLKGYFGSLCCLSLIKKGFDLDEERCVVLIISTTGDGEIPEKASKFWRYLKSKVKSGCNLKHIKFALLALGDTNYTNFCNSGKQFEAKLLELNAEKFYATGYADDGTGLELVVEPWIEGLWSHLALALKNSNLKPINSSMDPHLEQVSSIAENECLTSSSKLENEDLKVPALPKSFLKCDYFSDENTHSIIDYNSFKLPSAASEVFYSKIQSSRFLTHDESLKQVLELTLDISDGNVEYFPGDSFGIFPNNDYSEVGQLLSRLGLDKYAHKPVSIIPTAAKLIPPHLLYNLTLTDLFAKLLEIRAVPKKVFLRVLAGFTSKETESRRLLELCSRQGAEQYQRYIREPNLCLLDILSAFPSCKPSIESVLEHFPPLSPRFYSVANSISSDPNNIKIAVSVVEFDKEDFHSAKRYGVCSGFFNSIVRNQLKCFTAADELLKKFENLSIQDLKLPIYLRTNKSFRLPESSEIPIVMIGPGTGVAPFIGFIEEMSKRQDRTSCTWLLFGCRHQQYDFIYKEEIMKLKSNKTISDLFLSFSRDPGAFKYVQDHLISNKEKFFKLINESNAHVYVCGDAKGMAKNVYECIVSIVKEFKGVSEKEATQYVVDMQTSKRYLQDIWT